MRNMVSVFKRELRGYFATPVAYVFIVIFLFVSGLFTFQVSRLFEAGQATLTPFFMWHPWLYLFLIPAVSMRLWSEERKSGTIEVLLTMPIKPGNAILGKFLAAWIFIGIALVLTFPVVLTVMYLGDPDMGVIVAGYIGSFLMAGAFLAIGTCMSALTKNQVVSFILAVVACAVIERVGLPSTGNYLAGFLPAGLVEAIAGMSFQTHFESIRKGVIEFKDVAFFLLLIVGWITACTIILKERKAA